MKIDSPAVVAAVEAVARNALPVFALALLLVLAGVAALWQLGLRYGVRREDSRWPPLAYLAGHLAWGFAVIAGGAALFAEIAEALGEGEQLGQLDQHFSDTLRATLPREVLQVFAVLTHLADTLTLTVLGVLVTLLLLHRRQQLLAAGWVLAVAGNALLNPALKGIFARTRPVHDHGLITAEGWSFPSGHASGSVVAYGMLAYLLVRLLPATWPAGLRLAAVLLAAALAFTAGSSRVFLQVHYASDVLAGFASGASWLAVCIGTLELARWRMDRRNQP
jgi:membrane-associated phospholipid phosphatase